MTDRNRIAWTALGLVAAAGIGFAAARWTAPSQTAPETHAEAEKHAEEGHGQSGEQQEVEEGFVSLAPAEAPAAGISVTAVSAGAAAELLLPGRVAFAPNAAAAVGAPVAGTIERIHAAPGTHIKRGATLATLRSAEGASARAALEAARAEAEAARAVLAREARLLEAGVVARQDFEAARAASLKADAELAAAHARLTALGAPDASGATMIRSPIAGTVTAVAVSPGAVVDQGAAVAEVGDQTQVELVFDAPAAAARSIRPGSRLLASRPDGNEVTGFVTAVAPSANATSATVRARPQGPVPPAGTPISARVLTQESAGLAVPSEAVQTVDGRAVVFVAEPKGFRARPVVTGRTALGRTEILRGVEAGERIAGKGAFLLKAELAKGEAEHGH